MSARELDIKKRILMTRMYRGLNIELRTEGENTTKNGGKKKKV